RLGYQLFNAGHLVEAEAVLGETTELAEGLGSVRIAARAACCLVPAIYYRRGPEAAELEGLRCAEWLAPTGDVYLQIQNLRNLAKCKLRRGQFELAEQWLKEALPLALEAGGWLTVEIYRYLVEADAKQDRLEDALELLVLARSAVTEQDPYAQAALVI